MADPKIEPLLPLNADVLDILLILLEHARHGYAIVHELEQRPGPLAPIDRGNLYRTLRTMTRDDLIEPLGATRPQIFGVAPLGKRVARAETQRIARQLRMARRRGLLMRG